MLAMSEVSKPLKVLPVTVKNSIRPVPPRPEYHHGEPSQAALQARKDALQTARTTALARVDGLVREQVDLSSGLHGDLAAMQSDGRELDALEAEQRETGLLARLQRTLNRRSAILARRSVSESLLGHYQTASRRLREASAFCDELSMCALELQDAVDTLHTDLVHTARDERASAERILSLEASLDGLGSEGLSPEALRARQDRLTFEERSESTALTLLRSRHELVQRELEPVRQLRDTVMKLHDEMSGFVMQANSAVDTAGRRIQALGMAADAPMVVAELHASLENLSEAMQATELYVEAAQDLVTRVLPDLSARLAAQQDVQGELDAAALEGLDRAQARALADRALRDAAEAEVDALTAEHS
ncbi:MAG TPA: hypothetical protein DFR83_08590 [Deltaproteobacteria bacterium]|nr:hypothetical protein [Deltaproteobacteria bacterium]